MVDVILASVDALALKIEEKLDVYEAIPEWTLEKVKEGV